jgi:hypothetical protein
VLSVKKTLAEQKALSRGQKKRLKKKEKFINARVMEGRAKETEQLL